MTAGWRIALVALIVPLVIAVAGPAEGEACNGASDMYTGVTECHYTHDQLVQAVHESAGHVRYQVRMVCLSDIDGGLCNNPRICEVPAGSVLYNVLASTDGAPFEFVGDVCLLSGQEGDFGGDTITIDMIVTAFRNLSWPVSPVTIEPPNGRTLVNLATNFLTTNSAPTTQHVTLLGHDVEIEATPTSWTWHFGDGADDTTSTPGAAYPDLEVTHAYLDAHVTVHPSADTLYHGRYRIDGGAWHDIPVERTIAGTPVDLQVLEARPVLVDPSG